MIIPNIQDHETYNKYLAEFEHFFDHEPLLGTPEGDRFQALGKLLQTFEEEHYPTND